MDYQCAQQNFLSNSDKNKNFFKTLFHPIEIDSYMQRHRIFEIIGELMIQISIQRPYNVIDFMIATLIEIARKFERNVVTIEFHNCIEDASRMLRQVAWKQDIPIVECVSEEMGKYLRECLRKGNGKFNIIRAGNSSDENVNKLMKFLTSSSLCNHHIIICDFKEEPASGEHFQIISDANYVKSHECHLKTSIELKLCADSLEEAIETVRYAKPLKPLKGEWNRRLLVVGRVGSGRKTQAALLAREFSLTLIDLDYMIAEYEQQSSGALKRHELGFWGFIQEALVKPQCLHNGYVIVSNVISKEMLRILVEKFIHSPNQIIFLHTSESKCRRRILRAGGTFSTSHQFCAYGNDLHKFLNYQMNLYNLYKREFVDYFYGKRQPQVFHVNGNGRVDGIKDRIWAHLVRS